MYILSIDQGTTGTTAVLIDSNTFEFVDKVNQEFEQIFPSPGLVEHNLNHIWSSVESTVRELLSKNSISGSQIKTIGITNQRETICPFTRDGVPLSNAIVWQDRRTDKYCAELRAKGLSQLFHKKTGLPLDPYFSGTKIKWLLENNSKVRTAKAQGDLLFGNIDTFLLYKLSGNESYKTDVTNASRTLLMNLDTLDWDQELLQILEIDQSLLPKICDSIGHFGETKGLTFLSDGISITGILGDQQAALFGQACFSEGSGKCTYGTGAFMLVNTGKNKKYSNNGLLTTVAYKYKDQVSYAIEGSSYIAGACVQWLRDNLTFFESSPEIEQLASSLKNLESAKDVFLLPFFTGIGSPHWISEAKAALLGLTRDTGKAEISRAALEGICFSINDLITAINADFGSQITELKVDGGAVRNNLLMSIQSEISNITIIRPKVIETTAYGAGLAAAIGAGLTTFEQVSELWKEECLFKNTSKNSKYFSYKKDKWADYIRRLYM